MKEYPAYQTLKIAVEIIVIVGVLFGLTKSYLDHRGKFHDDYDDADSTRIVRQVKIDSFQLTASDIKRAGIKTVSAKSINGNAFRIPNSAVVWKNGQAFVFILNNSNLFIMVPVRHRPRGGWVTSLSSESNVSESIGDSSAIVIKGAGLLLSRQYRSQVKGGDDD